ncbi:Ribosomal RNA small subunit methyltransferase B [Rhodobacteraceae bacterium THAF1]|nr:Ribosomal RNA small subunit methyltransferase B [Palleronia sp. THAF1]VDC17221.1 Ribosomal RNA small subunit methyltransferase B [Rhodobacteraceae bacterium THAF1]
MDTARAAALALLNAVTDEQRLLSEAMPDILAPLSGPERARAQRLAVTTLRWRDRADRALGPFLRMKPWPAVHNALRLAVVEVFVDGTASHGAVNAAVDMVRGLERGGTQTGMVNAVLRNVLRAGKWDDLPLPLLPKWLRKPLAADFGKAAMVDMEAVFAQVPPLDLTVKDDPAGWAERLGGTVTPTGSVRLTAPGQVSALPGFEDGAWWVQDAAAAIPARVLGAQPGERVLDMCAAPGGKTLQLAAAGAQVTALDISEGRMGRVTENLMRTGLSADVVIGDALAHTGEYDAVLLDAPCSATGTIRRHPDLPMAKDGSEFPDLFRLQEQMIDRALKLVKPGGRVVYCTCSLLIDEGEEQVRDALERNPGITVETTPLHVPGIDPNWIGAEGLRLRPDYWSDIGGMDGFFVAVFRTNV